MQDFLNDNSDNAYEKVVDALLASPQYGERWAGMWLDMARYSDTKGYEKDEARNIWQYRDYVIKAFNKDIPYNQFIKEQLAGDLLKTLPKNNTSLRPFIVIPLTMTKEVQMMKNLETPLWSTV
jgi:ribonuclease D